MIAPFIQPRPSSIEYQHSGTRFFRQACKSVLPDADESRRRAGDEEEVRSVVNDLQEDLRELPEDDFVNMLIRMQRF
jgi:hypothetical protein